MIWLTLDGAPRACLQVTVVFVSGFLSSHLWRVASSALSNSRSNRSPSGVREDAQAALPLRRLSSVRLPPLPFGDVDGE